MAAPAMFSQNEEPERFISLMEGMPLTLTLTLTPTLTLTLTLTLDLTPTVTVSLTLRVSRTRTRARRGSAPRSGRRPNAAAGPRRARSCR